MKTQLMAELLAILLITRPLLTVFHELGHAIPAILMTRERATIFLGSYGDTEQSFRFAVGKLEIWIKYNLFKWKGGLCVPHASNISINKKIIYTLTGPLASLSIGIVSCYMAFALKLTDFMSFLFLVFLLLSIFDFLKNIIPSSRSIVLHDGRIGHNDGTSLVRLFRHKRFPKQYFEAIALYNQKQYKEAAFLFDSLLSTGLQDQDTYRWAIYCHLLLKDYFKAKVYFSEFKKRFTMNSEDYSNLGLIYSHYENHEKAMKFYAKSLKLNPMNSYSLNNKGYTLNILEKYEEAIAFFDKALEIDKSFAYSYNNRGLSKIKLGRIEEGLHDLNLSFELDPYNSYYFRNLGIYHHDKGEYGKALKLFLKSRSLDRYTHNIDLLIAEAKDYLSRKI
jgi:Tfp pilus assembly protein PilF